MKIPSIILALVWLGVDASPAQVVGTNVNWRHVNAATNLAVGSNVFAPALAADDTRGPAMTEPPIVYVTNGPATSDLGVGATRMAPQEIRLLDDGAVADYGLIEVLFPAQITEAPLTILTPDGRKLACRATLLALHDRASGQTLVLGEVRKTIGELSDRNTVVYPDAFDTIRAGIRYRYKHYSLEQDILLYDQIELPKAFQAENVQLEVWSEWFDSTPDSKVSQTIDLRPLAASEVQAGAPAIDDTLQFGAMRIADGYAFGLQSEGDKIPVAKSFVRIEAREWLIESVDYLALKPKLDQLPKSQASLSPDKLKSDRGQLVRSLLARTDSKPAGNPRRMAKASGPVKDSVVLDFVIVSGVPVPAGAVSWWPGGGNANDAIAASANHGNWVGTSGYGSGKVGQGFSFSGSSYLRVPHTAGLGPTTGLTCEAWVWVASGASGARVIALKGTPYQWQYLLALDVPNNTVYGLVETSVYITSSTSLTPDTWNHIAMTYDASSEFLALYINGQAEPPVSVANGLIPNTDPLFIGGSGDAMYPWPFVGSIDEPAVYNRALSAVEVESIYNAGAAGKINPNCVAPPADIAGWWAGDDNAYDLARTNSGALVGNTTYVPAVVGQGFSFDGTGDGVTIPNAAGLNIGAGDNFTIEAWIQPLTNSTTYGVTSIVDKRVAPNTTHCLGYVFCLVNGTMNLRISDSIGGIGANFADTQDLRIGSGYHHIAVTVNRGSATGGHFYVDGVQRPVVFNPTVVSGSLSNAGAFLIGIHAQTGFNGGHKGVLDEVTFYRRELTSTEIAALYSAGSAGKCKVDTDGDGLTELQEAFLGTNPNNQDTDGDDMDDGWEWDHFGIFSGDGSEDYDSDGVTDLQEYNARSDPNTILFDTVFENLRVNANTATGTVAVIRGAPAKMAILLDNTNFAAASWQGYNSTVLLNLGATNGSHEAWIGLKGRATTSGATWSAWPLTRDTAAPVIYITNPVVSTASQPILQLQGYSPEPLLSLRYDVTNAAGSLTNVEGYVTTQWFDTNLFELTTNWFECVDIQLTNGDNTITLRATDLAGNVATNVYTYVLDYTGDTTAPALTVYWPQDGTKISGNTSTFRGWIDDATANVTAQIVDANDVTNVVSGLLERDGLLWVEDLPLGAGANTLTLTMADAANNVSVAILTIVQSTVQLVIEDLTGTDLNQPRITVSGTINVGGHKIWVNGREVTNVSGGSWSVQGVPVNEGGTAVIQARAIPDTDNGGNGSGGSGGSNATLENPGNPNSANSQTVEAAPEKQPRVVTIRYYKNWAYDSVEIDEDPETDSRTEYIQWFQGTPGYWTQDSCWGNLNHDNYYYRWYDARWNAIGVGTEKGTTIGRGSRGEICGVQPFGDEYPYMTPDDWPGETCRGASVRYWLADTFQQYLQSVSRRARTVYVLHTGGKKVSGRKNLFVLNAEAVGVRDLFFPEIDYYTDTYPIAPSAIQLGDLGKLSSDSRLYAALDDGATRNVTPLVAGSQYYRYSQPWLSKHKLRITANGQDCESLSFFFRPTFIVGQYVSFGAEWVQAQPYSGAPQGIVDYLTTNKWEFGGHFYNDGTNAVPGVSFPTCSINYFVNANMLADDPTTAWWVSGGYGYPRSYAVSLEKGLTFANGQHVVVTGSGTFMMYRPAATISPYPSKVGVYNFPGEGWHLTFFDYVEVHPPPSRHGITFSNSISVPGGFSGTRRWVQVASGTPGRTLTDANSTTHVFIPNGPSPYADPVFYPHFEGSNPVDDPGMPLRSDCVRGEASDSFRMWMMFLPDVSGQWVPLRAVNWSWSGIATNNGSGAWGLASDPEAFQVGSTEDTETYPHWKKSPLSDGDYVPPFSP